MIRVSLFGPVFPAAASAEVGVVTACPVHQDGRVKQLATTGTLPGFKRTDKIIKFFGEHATLAAWTLHINPPEVRFSHISQYWRSLQQACQNKIETMTTQTSNKKMRYF